MNRDLRDLVLAKQIITRVERKNLSNTLEISAGKI